MNIRTATPNDLENIVKLGNKMLDLHCAFDPYYCIYREYDDITDFYRDELSKKGRFYVVAENDNGELIGFASASITSIPNTPTPVIGTLIASFVLEDYRRQGIGTKFYEKRMDWFKANNVKHVEMSVDAHNKTALNLWKKFGFKDYQYKLKLDL